MPLPLIRAVSVHYILQDIPRRAISQSQSYRVGLVLLLNSRRQSILINWFSKTDLWSAWMKWHSRGIDLLRNRHSAVPGVRHHFTEMNNRPPLGCAMRAQGVNTTAISPVHRLILILWSSRDHANFKALKLPNSLSLSLPFRQYLFTPGLRFDSVNLN